MTDWIKRTDDFALPVFYTCIALFVVGWLKFQLPPLGIYIADYVVRIAIIVIVLSATGFSAFHGRLTEPWKAVLFGLTVCWLMLQIENLIWALTPPLPWFIGWSFPIIDSPMLRWCDAIFGVALVAVSEELVFRYLPLRIGERRGWTPSRLYIVSVAAFAAIHAPQGFVRVLYSALFGMLAMVLYRRYGSLWVPVIVHFLVDFVLFSDVACWMNVRSCS